MTNIYIKIDGHNRVVACDGGYTTPSSISGWILIDSGNGDKYNLCQSHYFDGGLFTDDGIYRWKYVDGECALRSEDELESDRLAFPEPAATTDERIAQLENQLTDTQLALCDAYEYQIETEEQLTETQMALCDVYELVESMMEVEE